MTMEYAEYYTYDNYKNWEGDWELIGGVAYAMAPSPKIKHQVISAKIANQIEISNKCENCMVAVELDWKISEDTVLRPDVVLICDEEGDYITKAPKIIAEVISPETARRDETIKFQIYEKEKVLYYILVYPDDLKAKIYKLKNDKFDKIGDYTKEKAILEECNIEIDFNEVFKKFKK